MFSIYTFLGNEQSTLPAFPPWTAQAQATELPGLFPRSCLPPHQLRLQYAQPLRPQAREDVQGQVGPTARGKCGFRRTGKVRKDVQTETDKAGIHTGRVSLCLF